MARIRTIKPSFWSHELLSALPAEWHMLAGAILNYADDHGYFNANPELVKAGTMPLRVFDVAGALAGLVGVDFVVLGTATDGRRFGRVLNFHDHQRVDRPQKSVIATMSIIWEREDATPEGGGRFSASQNSLIDRRSIDDRSLQEGNGMEGNGKEGNSTPTALRARFERFWSAYPRARRVGKDAAWQVWQRRKPGDDLTNRIITALEAQKGTSQWQKDGGQFIPHPRTWLNQGRWQDEVVSDPRAEAVADGEEYTKWLQQQRDARRA